MNKGFLISAGLLVLVACAQSAPKEPSMLTVRAGVNILFSGDAKDFTKSSGLSLGAGYDLTSKGFLSPLSKPSIDFDWSSNVGNGNRLTVYGLTYTERVPFSMGDSKADKAGFVPYGGLGVGVAYSDLDATKLVSLGGSGGSVRVGVGSKKINFGGRVILGAMFQERFSVEAAYHLNGSNDGARTDSFTVMLGVKF